MEIIIQGDIMKIKTIHISTLLLIIFLFTSTDKLLATEYKNVEDAIKVKIPPAGLKPVVLSDNFCFSDTDNDGIPNAFEKKSGLDPDNPNDALYDMDDDGFPNIFEFQHATRINKGISHPPMYMRLHLLEFKETLLPFQFTVVNINGDKKKSADWAIKIRSAGSPFTVFKYLGSTIVLDKTRYTITKIDARHEDKRQGGTIVKTDKSKIYLKSKGGKYTIIMQVGKSVYSPRLKAVIEDLGTGRMYHVGENDIISMYCRTKQLVSKRTGKKLRRKIIKYKVLKVDRQKKQVVIEQTRKHNPQKYVLTSRAFMPKPIKAVIKPTVIQTAGLKPTTQDDVTVTLKDMLYVNMFAHKYTTQHPLICTKGGDYPGGVEMIFIKQSNPKEWVHAVFPKRTAVPKNKKNAVVLRGYFQNVQNIDNYKIKRVPVDYKYFVVSSWEYQK